MHLTIIKENYPLIACVTLVDIRHLINGNEVLIGMESSALMQMFNTQTKRKINTLPVITFHT